MLFLLTRLIYLIQHVKYKTGYFRARIFMSSLTTGTVFVFITVFLIALITIRSNLAAHPDLFFFFIVITRNLRGLKLIR